LREQRDETARPRRKPIGAASTPGRRGDRVIAASRSVTYTPRPLRGTALELLRAAELAAKDCEAMELYVYETPHGLIADFRPYLDGHDHSFDDHRALRPDDPRWEKIRALRHPERQSSLAGEVRYVGKAETVWRELMVFPILWKGDYDPDPWEASSDAARADEESAAAV